MKPMLLKETDNPRKYINSTDWVMQRKVDGRRLMVECGPKPRFFNRTGDPIDCPIDPKMFTDERVAGWTLDGEAKLDSFFVFDGFTDPTEGFVSRFRKVERLLDMFGYMWLEYPIHALEFEDDPYGKQRWFDEMRELNYEGVVFRKKNAPYRPNRSSAALKFKFTKTVDCIVLEVNTNPQNLVLGMLKGDKLVEVGKVSSLTGDGPKCKAGDVVEVKFLYVSSGGRLYQPVTPKLRLDKKPEECTIDQLEGLKAHK